MKVRLATQDLIRALTRAYGIVDKRSSMPILSYALLETVGNDTVRISAASAETRLTATYPASVDEPGRIAVNARQCYEIAKTLPGETVDLDSSEDETGVALVSGPSRFKLVVASADDFPGDEVHTAHTTFTIDASSMARMIDRTLFCASSDENRHSLNGVYFISPKENVLRLVATDGHRLAMVEESFEHSIPCPEGVILPRKGLLELRRTLADSEGNNPEHPQTVELGFTDSHAILQAGAVTLQARLVEGQFPAYEKVIPKDPTLEGSMARAGLIDALKRVSLLSHGRGHMVRLSFQSDGLTLAAEDPEQGEASETIPVQFSGDEPIVMGFNARYLLDVLSHIDEKGVRFRFSDPLSPTLLQPIEDTRFLSVVMPMRL